MTMTVQRLALIGLGLIGSSIARATREKLPATEVIGFAASARTRQRAQELGFCHSVRESAAEAVRDADVVILCAPVGANASIAAEIGRHLKQGAIVSDVGSVKGAVIRDVQPHLPAHAQFIPGHPVAGTENSGPDAGFSSLFEDRWCILTPVPPATEVALSNLRTFWEALGSHVEVMDAQHHDLVLAITSHIPHLIAYNIVGTAADLETVTQSEVIKFSAGGFRDFTRIAASDPTMWRDVFLNNRDAVLEMLGRFNEDLSALQRMIRFGDGEGLQELFTRTRAIRKGIVALGQETPEADFGRRK
jgi:cyclohexadieny/prephenate dehydrogenase